MLMLQAEGLADHIEDGSASKGSGEHIGYKKGKAAKISAEENFAFKKGKGGGGGGSTIRRNTPTWEQEDAKIMMFITMALHDEDEEKSRNCKTAKQLWQKLTNLYEKAK